jgi:hypothetical protein
MVIRPIILVLNYYRVCLVPIVLYSMKLQYFWPYSITDIIFILLYYLYYI